MTDLRSLTVVDMAEAVAYVAARFHATVDYSCPVWRIMAPSGRIHEGFSLAEAVTWYELREPEHVPDTCSYCQQEFAFSNPWTLDAGSFFHELCLKSAWAEVDALRMDHERELQEWR